MSHPAQEPMNFIRRWLPENLSDKTVLDYACGSGRHGRLALKHGATVTFADIKLEAVEDLAAQDRATLVQADLEREFKEPEETLSDIWPFDGQQYDYVIVTNYLYRPRLKDIFRLVKPEGMILYQTFAIGNEAYGRPSNPNFLLGSGELLDHAKDEFDILHFEEGRVETPSLAMIQRLAAKAL